MFSPHICHIFLFIFKIPFYFSMKITLSERLLNNTSEVGGLLVAKPFLKLAHVGVGSIEH